ncbi:hypothetical protein MRB53_013122 [Persea americana]|uniref:Uncharacterized protein n=1 Tax=Persea americana TaxID=3435 RepID=A0ACC2K735_PERAE|nr:hypothetical protein MRB53_013122 [Persea americana]
MGCPISKLDNEEAVQLCKDRKRFIKQAIESRIRFAAGHIAYIQSLRRVSLALRDYIEGYEHLEFSSNPYAIHSSTPIKKTAPEIIAVPLRSLCVNTTPVESQIRTSQVINYLRSGGNPSISIEERPRSPETMRIESYSPSHHYGIDGFFSMQSPPYNSSFYSSPYNKPSYPPPSPQTSEWDFFWNPFSSLDTYGYPTRESLDQIAAEGQTTELMQVREEEGIPDLEELEEKKEKGKTEEGEERKKIDLNSAAKAVEGNDGGIEVDIGTETKHEAKGLQSQATESIEVSEAHDEVELGVANEEREASDRDEAEETPDFTVYVDRRPTSMEEVVKDLETQFKIVCDSAKEVSTMLEASKAQFSSTSNEFTAAKMLNPVALFRSVSSHSTLSRPFHASSSSRNDSYDSSSDISEESLVFLGSHQSTLDRLYAWEKKLYKEVKSGERIRIAYEKKCMQLRNQNAKGEDPSILEKTRAIVRGLHTQIKVSMHSVESVSKRIETLRDEELQPQLMDLIQGLARMWCAMGVCHSSQKQTLQEAKLLLPDTPPKPTDTSAITILPRLARSATVLESELRNWRDCFQSWIAAQRSYVRFLASWVLRCARPNTDTDTRTTPFSPRPSTRNPPIFPICIQWSRRLDALSVAHVMDGLDSWSDGVVSAFVDGRTKSVGGGVSANTEEVTVEKTEEVAVKAVWEGMSVAFSSLTEFAFCSGKMYEELVNQWEKDTWTEVKVEV